MQPIQDKDFDQLFKDRFEDAEITPSRDLWSSIESEIEPKKKRIIPVYWLSAAAVLIIATVGISIYQQQKSGPKQYANNVLPKGQNPVIVEPQTKDTLVSGIAPIKDVVKTLPVDAKPITTLAKTKVKDNVKPIENQKVISAPDIQKQETMIAKAEAPKKDIKTKIEEAVFQTKEESVLAANNGNEPLADEVIDNSYPIERKGIRNVGDVVNLIVNTMDKRKDKLIQFRTDDDDSSISVVNIGPFRIGKKNRK